MGIFEAKIVTVVVFVALNIVESKYLLVKILQRDKYEKSTGVSLPLASFRSNGPSSGTFVLMQFQIMYNNTTKNSVHTVEIIYLFKSG